MLRVPSTGPPALISEPYDFATLEEAQARVAEFEDSHLVVHHTYFDIRSYHGDRQDALKREGILS